MESSRDSSVWRNLAVTFGGGLALGAVGMRLTQTALRPVEITPRPGSNPSTDRLSLMEHRLARVEQTPAAAPAAATAPTAGTPQIDQKVLEAVVGAVDARLHEHTGQVERRIADLEARVTVELQSLHHQDRTFAEATGKNLAELQQQFRQESADLRSALQNDLRHFSETVSKAAGDHAEIQVKLQALHQQDRQIADATEQHLADLRSEFRQEAGALRQSVDGELGQFKATVSQEIADRVSARTRMLEHSIETRIVTAAAAAAAAQFDENLAPLRAEVQTKERELTELRRRLAESEKAVLDVILSIGDVCRHAADRMTGPPDTRVSAPPPPPVVEAPPVVVPEVAAVAPEIVALPTEPTPSKPPATETRAVAQLGVDPALAQAIPDFLHDSNRSRPWRIPLVSSFVLMSTGCCLAFMHYL